MSEVIKGNWRTAYGYSFLSSDDLETNQEVTMTIKAVTWEDSYDLKTKKEKKLFSVSFMERDRLLALNATNAKSISDIAGSPMVEKWQGVRITLYREFGKWFGKEQYALRVKAPEVTQNKAQA